MFPIKYIDNNLVWNKDNEVFAYYELIPYNYSFLSAEQKFIVHDSFRQLIAQSREGKIHALQIATESNLSIICYDLSNLSEYAKVSNAAFKLMKKHLPGPFTFILPTSSELPKIYKNRKEVGIRVPDNNITRTLVQSLGNPILTMSIRDEDEVIEYTTDPELIHEKYEHQVDIVIDGGFGGLEASTVIDCTTDNFEIVRQGKGEL